MPDRQYTNYKFGKGSYPRSRLAMRNNLHRKGFSLRQAKDWPTMQIYLREEHAPHLLPPGHVLPWDAPTAPDSGGGESSGGGRASAGASHFPSKHNNTQNATNQHTLLLLCPQCGSHPRTAVLTRGSGDLDCTHCAARYTTDNYIAHLLNLGHPSRGPLSLGPLAKGGGGQGGQGVRNGGGHTHDVQPHPLDYT